MGKTLTATATEAGYTNGPPTTSTLRLRPVPLRPASAVECVPLHPTFGAEVRGIDFSKALTPEIVDEIKTAIGKYGVVCFRNTGMTDEQFVALGRSLGELGEAESRRFPTKMLSDPSNIYPDGTLIQPGDLNWYLRKETALFHKDTTYDARRARWTGIICRQCPPPGTGGATEFGDTRTVYDDLEPEMKKHLQGKVGVHSHFHSRRVALPNFPTFAALDPWDFPMHKHDLVIDHLGCPGRKDLFIASHLHHIDGMDANESSELITKLRKTVEQPKYVLKIYYNQPGDVCIWDNTAVVHRAGGNEGEGWAGKYPRDIRKFLVYDDSEQAWGRNRRDLPKHFAGPIIQAKHEELYGKEGKVFDFEEDP